MNEFESNSDACNREWKFEAWNRECRISNQVRCLESEMEEFEPISKLGIGNGGVRAKFEAWNRKWRRSRPVPTLGIGNGRVRAKFKVLNWK